MNKAEFRKNIGIIFGNLVALAGVIGWGWFIWSLCGSGLSFWEKILTEAVSYALIISLCWYCTLPGAGCIAVKVLYDYRDQDGGRR